MMERLGIASAEVGAHGPVEDIILKQGIKAAQHGVGLAGEFGHPCKDIFVFMAINQHRAALCGVGSCFFLPTSRLCS